LHRNINCSNNKYEYFLRSRKANGDFSLDTARENVAHYKYEESK
jgi:hypothetical protein